MAGLRGNYINMINKKIVAIIPARGGSKSIPRKNIKLFCGKPLIYWKIKAAQDSNIFDKIIVSTDDQEIADIAKSFGAEIPFLRPAKLAEDTTPTVEVLEHTLKQLQNSGYTPDVFVLLEPTTPGTSSTNIKEAVETFFKKDADSVISLVKVPTQYNANWQFILDENNETSLFTGTPISKIIRRRQDLPATYYRNSALYVFKPSLLQEKIPNFYGIKTYGYIMDATESFDLDRPEDWEFAEDKLKALLTKRSNK